MTRILVLVAPGETELPGLSALPDDAQVQTLSAEADLRGALPEADVLVVTDFRTGLLERCWPAQPKLEWVHATSAGVAALLFPALVESDIPITNAKGILTVALPSMCWAQCCCSPRTPWATWHCSASIVGSIAIPRWSINAAR